MLLCSIASKENTFQIHNQSFGNPFGINDKLIIF
jgi:hypothetical protein